jgi:hypothetical protein
VTDRTIDSHIKNLRRNWSRWMKNSPSSAPSMAWVIAGKLMPADWYDLHPLPDGISFIDAVDCASHPGIGGTSATDSFMQEAC